MTNGHGPHPHARPMSASPSGRHGPSPDTREQIHFLLLPCAGEYGGGWPVGFKISLSFFCICLLNVYFMDVYFCLGCKGHLSLLDVVCFVICIGDVSKRRFAKLRKNSLWSCWDSENVYSHHVGCAEQESPKIEVQKAKSTTTLPNMC